MVPDLKKIIDRWLVGDINKAKDTEICLLYKKYGSDKKGEVSKGEHNYSIFYNEIFKTIKHNALDIFELGLGTNNPNLPSSMGINGKPGASLYALEEYFSNACIYGADIDKDILFQTEKIKTFYCDQTDPVSINNLWNIINKKMDLIIEDGLHEYHANYCFLINTLTHLKDNGIYVAEDLPSNAKENFYEEREDIMKQFNLKTFEIIQTSKSPILAIQKI